MTPNPTFRQAIPADAAAITDIYNDYVLNTTATFDTRPFETREMGERITLLTPLYPFLICETPDRGVAGYACAHPWKDKAAYAHTLETSIYMHPSAIGHGWGQQLMKRLIEECKNAHAHALIACVTAENERSIRFHQQLGFKQVSHFLKVGSKYGRVLDVVDLELLLQT